MKITTLCYITHGDKWLLLHRISKKNDENAGKWIGVGGKAEEGESPEECLIREVREETGLNVAESYRLRGIVTFVSDEYGTEYMFLYSVRNPAGQADILSCTEGRLEWIRDCDMERLPMWEGDRIFLRLIRQDHPFFSLKLCYCGEKLCRTVLDGTELDL